MIGKRLLGVAGAGVLVSFLGVLAACSSDEKADAAETLRSANVAITLHDASGTAVGEGAGVLIGPRVVLTSAHLVAGKSKWTIRTADGKVATGVRGLTKDWRVYDSMKAHPRKNDVAVIYLDKPIELAHFPKLATQHVKSGSEATRVRKLDGAFANTAAKLERVKSFPNAYLTSIPTSETLVTGSAVVNADFEIVGLVTGRGLSTGKLYVSRVDRVVKWLSPKVACGGASKLSAASLTTRTYGTPPPKPGCEDGGTGTSSGSSGGSSSGSSGGSSSGSSGASSSGSSGDGTSSGSSGASSGSSGTGTDGPDGNGTCDDGGGLCSGDCVGVGGGPGDGSVDTSSSSSSSGGTGTSNPDGTGTTPDGSGGASSSSGSTSGGTPSTGSSGSDGNPDGTTSSSSGGATSGGTASGGNPSTGSSGNDGQTGGADTDGTTSSSSSSSSSGASSSGTGAGGADDGIPDACTGEDDFPELCPPEDGACSGPNCGGGAPDDLIDYGKCACTTSSSPAATGPVILR